MACGHRLALVAVAIAAAAATRAVLAAGGLGDVGSSASSRARLTARAIWLWWRRQAPVMRRERILPFSEMNRRSAVDVLVVDLLDLVLAVRAGLAPAAAGPALLVTAPHGLAVALLCHLRNLAKSSNVRARATLLARGEASL